MCCSRSRRLTEEGRSNSDQRVFVFVTRTLVAGEALWGYPSNSQFECERNHLSERKNHVSNKKEKRRGGTRGDGTKTMPTEDGVVEFFHGGGGTRTVRSGRCTLSSTEADRRRKAKLEKSEPRTAAGRAENVTEPCGGSAKTMFALATRTYSVHS
jgi:hypothetical protein